MCFGVPKRGRGAIIRGNTVYIPTEMVFLTFPIILLIIAKPFCYFCILEQQIRIFVTVLIVLIKPTVSKNPD